MSTDLEELRNQLIDYYGTAMANGNPLAMMDLIQVETASEETLIDYAERNNFLNVFFEEDY